MARALSYTHSHTHSQMVGKEMAKRRHLKRDRKTAIEGAEVMWFGKLFHIGGRTTETGRARSPMVDSGVRPTINDVAILHNSNTRRTLGFVLRRV